MALEKTSHIWMNGTLVPWDDARVHALTHGLHYGTGAIEGIRCYKTAKGTAVFRLTDHMNRLINISSKVMILEPAYSAEDMVEATKHLLRQTGLEHGYIRPLVYRGDGEMGLNPLTTPTDALIAAFNWGTYHSAESQDAGLRVCISSWQRINDNSLPPTAKTTANYANSALAKVDSLRAGFDDAVLLNQHGFVAEATGMNIFSVKDGVITTPPLNSGALAGIRRESAMCIARDLGIEVVEANLRRTDLYLSDELFVTGTAAELVPIRSVDDREVGPLGPITRQLREVMREIVRGESDKYASWMEYV